MVAVAGNANSSKKASPERIAELEDELGMEVSPGLEAHEQPGIISLRSAASPHAEERIEAFSINSKKYSILTRPRTNQALRYVHLARTRGSEIAVDYMLEVLLGAEGYQALLDFDDLTEENLTAVINAASRIMAGAVETPKEKPRRGSRKSAG